MMEEPIPIKRTEPLITAEETIALDKARTDRHIQWVFLGLVVVVVVGLLIPLSVWLTRLALGG
jgi:hypothetical protein